MSGGVMILVGVVLAVAGIWSVRVALTTAGAGAAWLVADAFGAGVGAGLLIAAAGGLLALLLGLLASRVMFFVVGTVLGAVVGARLFGILDTGDASVLLAAVFVPAVAVLAGVAVERWRERLIGWATAIGGSALVLSGLGLVAPRALGFLRDPGDHGGQALATLLWVAAAVGARVAQRRGVLAPPGRVRAGAG